EWYVYWKFAGDSGYPPKISWKGSTGTQTPEILWPQPTCMIMPGEIVEYGYEGEVVYPIRVQLTGGKVHAEARLSYLTCNTSCVPYKYTFTLDIPSGPAATVDAEADALIRRYLALVPSRDLTEEA